MSSLGLGGIGGIGLHVIVAIFFAVHAVRTHQNMYWLLLLFLFPGLGSVVYFFAVYLPSLRQTRGARAAGRAIRQMVDPNRAVREARDAFDRAPTVDHRMRLGAALLDAGQPAEALTHYQAAANGPFASDPALLEGLARAQVATGQPCAGAGHAGDAVRAPPAGARAGHALAAVRAGAGRHRRAGHAGRVRAGPDQRQRCRAALPVCRLAGSPARCRRPRARESALCRYRP